MGYVGSPPSCGSLLIFSPPSSVGDPLDVKCFVANPAPCELYINFSPALKPSSNMSKQAGAEFLIRW